MIIRGSQPISQLPDGMVLSKGFEVDIDDQSIKDLMRAAAIELSLVNNGVGELIKAVEEVLRQRGMITQETITPWLEPIPTRYLDNLAAAVKKVREGDPTEPVVGLV